MGKYIIKVNGIEYHSYTDFCKDFNIDYKEFMKYKHENPSQLDLMEHFFSRVMIKMTDSSIWVSGLHNKYKLIKANCPSCLSGCDDIVYQNSGPIVRIYCSKCGLIYNDGDAKKNGFNDVIEYWNHIGIYMPMTEE